MMRYLGIFLMAASAAGGGVYLAQRWRERLRLLLSFRQAVTLLQRQILYSGAALAEALREAGERAAAGQNGNCAEPGRFLVRVAEAMGREAESPVSLLWSREARAFPRDFPLRERDREALLALGRQLGCGDREMQERTIAFYLDETETSIAQLRAEAEKKAQLCQSLGAAAGLFLAVVML